MAKQKIGELVEQELSGFLAENGYELFHTEFRKEGKDWFLRVFIDRLWTEGQEKPEYIGTEDCEKVSRFLSDRLDEIDPIEQNYYLEVSSPGLERPLLREKDYRRFSGEKAEIRLYEPMDGKKSITGTLLGLRNGLVQIEADGGGTMEIPLEKIAKAKLIVAF